MNLIMCSMNIIMNLSTQNPGIHRGIQNPPRIQVDSGISYVKPGCGGPLDAGS